MPDGVHYNCNSAHLLNVDKLLVGRAWESLLLQVLHLQKIAVVY